MTAVEWAAANMTFLEHTYAGKWLAITATGVIATSEDDWDVFELALEQGVTSPLVIKISEFIPPKKYRGPSIKHEKPQKARAQGPPSRLLLRNRRPLPNR